MSQVDLMQAVQLITSRYPAKIELYPCLAALNELHFELFERFMMVERFSINASNRDSYFAKSICAGGPIVNTPYTRW